MSRRTRAGEPNSYNLVRVSPPRLEIEVRAWVGRSFGALRRAAFEKTDAGWRAVA